MANYYLKNFTANSISTIWTTGFQLVSVPLFLTYWGASKYGEWIVLNSFIVFFQMSDIGLNTASLNSFVINYQKGDFDICKKIITNSLAIISSIFLVVFFVLVFLLKLNFFEKFLKFEFLEIKNISIYLLLLFFYTYIGTISNSIGSIYSAVGKYSRGVMIDNLFKFFEGVTLIILIISKISPGYILFGYLVIRLFLLLVKCVDTNRFYSIKLNVANLNYLEFKKIIKPSLAFFAIPISNTFIFQGFTLIVNFYFGAPSVVLYSTTRTLVNMIKAVSDIITKSMWPNISFEFAKRNFKLVRLYHSRTIFYSLVIFFISFVFFMAFSKPVYLHWTRGKSDYDVILVSMLLVAMLFNLIQSSSGLILQATNQHSKYVIYYFCYYLIGLITAFIFANFIGSFSFLAIGLIIPEFLLILFTTRSTLFLTYDNFRRFKKRIIFDFHFHLKEIKNFISKNWHGFLI